MLISFMVCDVGKGEVDITTFIGTGRAHLHSELDREVYVVAPVEDELCPAGHCWRLWRAMCGLKDAARAFDRLCETVMLEMGFTVGVGYACLYFHATRRACAYRHGDGFVGSGQRKELLWFRDELSQGLIVKCRAILGPRADLGDVQVVVCLNRILLWCRADLFGPE